MIVTKGNGRGEQMVRMAKRSHGRCGRYSRSGIAVAAAVLVSMVATESSHAAQNATAVMLPPDAFATVNGVALSQTQFEQTLRDTGQPDSPVARQIIRKGLLERELLRQAAESEKLGDTPGVRSAANKARVDAENRLYIATHLNPETVTDAQVRARYDAIVAEMGPQQYRVSVITVPDDEAAKAVLAQLRNGVPFGTLAAQLGSVSGRNNDGTLPGWVSFRTPPAEGHTMGLALPLAREISTLNVGETSRPAVAVGSARAIVKLDAKRATLVPSYDSTKGALRQSLEAAAREQAYGRLIGELAHSSVIVQTGAPETATEGPGSLVKQERP